LAFLYTGLEKRELTDDDSYFSSQTNFFEKKVAEYAKTGVARREDDSGDGTQKNTHAFSLEEDF